MFNLVSLSLKYNYTSFRSICSRHPTQYLLKKIMVEKRNLQGRQLDHLSADITNMGKNRVSTKPYFVQSPVQETLKKPTRKAIKKNK